MTVTAERYGRAYAASISQWATTLSGLLPSACGLRGVQSLNLQYRHCLWTEQVPVTVSSEEGQPLGRADLYVAGPPGSYFLDDPAKKAMLRHGAD